MQYTFKLDAFEGPLELLLKLIEDERLDITTISLAKVTDQYLSYVHAEDQLPPDEVADFLVVAAKLIYLKSKYLLPALQIEDEDGEDLEHQLKIYREYYNASKIIERMIGAGAFSYARTMPLKLPREAGFSPPPSLKLSDMPAIILSVIGRLEAIARLPKIILKATVSIREKIDHLKLAIRDGMIEFQRTYDGSNKHDVIVSFLALLELVKMRHVSANQGDLFTTITIQRGERYE